MKIIKSIARWLFWLVVWPVAVLFPSQTPWLDFFERLWLSLEGIVWMVMCAFCFCLSFLVFYFNPFSTDSFAVLLGLFCGVAAFCYYVHAYHLFLDERPGKYKKAASDSGENIKPMSHFRIWWDDVIFAKAIRLGRRVLDCVTGRHWQRKMAEMLKSDGDYFGDIAKEHYISRRQAEKILDRQFKEMAKAVRVRTAVLTW